MKHYTISLTITAEDNNEQIVQLRSPHLNGAQVMDMLALATRGIIIEPDPPIMTAPKPRKKRRLFHGPTAKDIKRIGDL